MEKRRTFSQYRRIDLTILALMYAVFEYIIVRTARGTLFRDQVFTVSLAAAITSTVYMRWGLWGAIHAALSGALFCLYSGGTRAQLLIYTLGNLCSLPAVLALKKVGPERVRTGYWSRMLFPLSVILLMQAGRALFAVLFGASPAVAVGFFTTDSLSILFTLVVVWVASRLDGVYEEQRHYLLRMQEKNSRQN